MTSVATMRIALKDADFRVAMMITIASAIQLQRRKPGILVFWIVAVKNQMRTVRGFAGFVAARERTTSYAIVSRRDYAAPIA